MHVMRILLSALSLSLFVGVFVHAQTGVDFSGRWILESLATADTPTALTVRQTLVTSNVRGEAMKPHFSDIAIDREVGGRTRSEGYGIGIIGGVVGGGERRQGAVTWNANALVFESDSYTGLSPRTGVWTSRRDVWSLDADGRLHVAITTRGSGEEPTTVAAVYRRQ